MQKIETHPILEIEEQEKVYFEYEGTKIEGQKGFTIAAALHQAGYPVHTHSLQNRNRSLECGIGKCGACEMLVDGQIRRICITKVDRVKTVGEIPKEYRPVKQIMETEAPLKIYRTEVAIIGAGPAGLAARDVLNRHRVSNIVIDNNDLIGGQFMMQTHQFFFFEEEKKYGGMRGFEIATILAGESRDGIFLNSTVWDILEGKRLAVKNIETEEIYYIDAEHLIVATGAVPFMPAFENDDVPGVYTAAVVQKMMNIEFTLLGKTVLTVGAGNIGYLTSYQLVQAGAKVKAIIEAMDCEGGFPVQASRVRRLGIPVLTSSPIPERPRTARRTPGSTSPGSRKSPILVSRLPTWGRTRWSPRTWGRTRPSRTCPPTSTTTSRTSRTPQTRGPRTSSSQTPRSIRASRATTASSTATIRPAC